MGEVGETDLVKRSYRGPDVDTMASACNPLLVIFGFEKGLSDSVLPTPTQGHLNIYTLRDAHLSTDVCTQNINIKNTDTHIWTPFPEAQGVQ